MRHRVKSKQFNRDTNHRKMLVRNLVRSLIEHGEIVTTLQKAKETRRWSDRLIHTAKTDSVAVRRQLHAWFGRRDVVSTLVEKIAPAMKKRQSGFTTIARLGKRRGDNTELVKLSLIEQRAERHTLKAKVDRPIKRRKVAKIGKRSVVSKTAARALAKKKAEAKKAAQVRQPALAQKAQKDSKKPVRVVPVGMTIRRTTAKGK
jgi:large subunit ribosomal protein L17